MKMKATEVTSLRQVPLVPTWPLPRVLLRACGSKTLLYCCLHPGRVRCSQDLVRYCVRACIFHCSLWDAVSPPPHIKTSSGYLVSAYQVPGTVLGSGGHQGGCLRNQQALEGRYLSLYSWLQGPSPGPFISRDAHTCL